MSRFRCSQNVDLLQHLSVEGIVSYLGQTAKGINSRFTCSGKLSSNKAVGVTYAQTGHNVFNSVEFPGVSKAKMLKLLEACSVASFGFEGKDVIDRNYRDAFKLDPKCFMTDFQLCDTPILKEIQSIVPNFSGLRAELYKLNVYAAGGFFKAHVDTPRSEQMFGSLVICLPSRFSGGQLVLRHGKEEVKYDWSSFASVLSNTIHWAAFFSDIEHEVLPVTEGYRVTLTYNLYHFPRQYNSEVHIKLYNFYKLLQAALSNPVFMREGGVLGFNCQYSYVFDIKWADLLVHMNCIEDKVEVVEKLQKFYPLEEYVHYSVSKQTEILKHYGFGDVDVKRILEVIPSVFPRLKGADHIVFESAKLLGLSVHVKPFLDPPCDSDDVTGYALKDCSQLHRFSSEHTASDEIQEQLAELFGETNICQYDLKCITWCQELCCDQPAGAVPCYGNEMSVNIWYKRAVILIGIPKWADHRQKLVEMSRSEQDMSGMAKETENIVEQCFTEIRPFNSSSY